MAPDQRGRHAARAALEAARQGVTPPGGFDAWLHLLAAPVGAGAAGPDLPGGGVRVATASLTAPNDPADPLALFFIPPQRVEAELRRLLEPLATGPARGVSDGPGGGAGGGPAGWLLQVGISGVEYRALAEPPAGFVPRYRLPRRSLEEPVWVPEEPLWCPHSRLAEEPATVARELCEALAQRLG
ncbi:hypothetical protein Tmar_0775 [Thermaerobacter marianensis DSM 12885]|uniref:Uncharacterized protein n=1 Tax=Thermaerobacter marianensis (strain ATCC 700841 / DSM 12885 / JCM 10246 / 7p75a) TaxID=644966 RepID=E6SII4_THEM7|nr:hypothetical protein [Thermaerobacter marianensis]ADU50890.1 hypothetical protein Tmar_0775 [Thermaerobacter marianensis DSM 12885]